MLKLAGKTLGPLASRVELHEGYIDTAPDGPFDAATCLLTLHFLPADERVKTLIGLRKRLKPDAPLIVAHHSFPLDGNQKMRWLNRYAAFAVASGSLAASDAGKSVEVIGTRLPSLSPEHDVKLMLEAGFENIELFYAAFTFKGWIAYNAR